MQTVSPWRPNTIQTTTADYYSKLANERRHSSRLQLLINQRAALENNKQLPGVIPFGEDHIGIRLPIAEANYKLTLCNVQSDSK